jgi:nitroreductase
MNSIVNNILSSLHWRYATKHFDASKKISSDDLHILCEVMRLSPSSFGLQPRKIVHVVDEAIRQQLVAYSWGQLQIVEASDLFVLAAKKNSNSTGYRDVCV